MKVSWSTGGAVAVLISVAFYLLNLPIASTLEATVALMLILVGAWTIVASIALVDRKDRTYYAAWGLVISLLSLFAYVKPAYAIAILLIAIVLLIVGMAITGRNRGAVTVSSGPPVASGGAPAANDPQDT